MLKTLFILFSLSLIPFGDCSLPQFTLSDFHSDNGENESKKVETLLTKSGVYANGCANKYGITPYQFAHDINLQEIAAYYLDGVKAEHTSPLSCIPNVSSSIWEQLVKYGGSE